VREDLGEGHTSFVQKVCVSQLHKTYLVLHTWDHIRLSSLAGGVVR